MRPTRPIDPQEFAWRLHEATPRTWVTTTLIVANVLVWLATVASGLSALSPRAIELLAWGGNHLPLTLREPWRLVSALFLHGGIIHLAFNMWVLRDAGRLAERFYGNTQLLIVYLVAGIAGSMASLFFSARTGVSVGASGAIFGVVGCLLAALMTRASLMPEELVRSLRRSMLIFVGYALGIGLLVPFIDNAAHLGGLAAGFLLGVVLVEKFDYETFYRQALTRGALALGASAVILWVIWRQLPASPA